MFFVRYRIYGVFTVGLSSMKSSEGGVGEISRDGENYCSETKTVTSTTNSIMALQLLGTSASNVSVFW